MLFRDTPLDNILVFIDQPSGASFISASSIPTSIRVHELNSLEKELNKLRVKKLSIVVTGHGGHNGISATQDISPCSLLNLIKGFSGVEYAFVLLGQCFAGTFNYLEARKVDASNNKIIPPEICIVGATELDYSISLEIDLKNLNSSMIDSFSCTEVWSANIFLLFFMLCVADPVDTDGDGSNTILDAYKFAGIHTNQVLRSLKTNALREIQVKLMNMINQISKDQASNDLVFQDLMDKAQQELLLSLEVVLTSQKPWILHANLGRKLLI